MKIGRIYLLVLLGGPAALLGEGNWAGIAADEAGFVDTGEFLGWLQVEKQPWLWSREMDLWIYAEDPGPDPAGVWAYIPVPGSPPVVNEPTWPDASNTGWQHTGVSLVPSDPITVTVDGTVIEGLEITSWPGIEVKASNVTIRRCRIVVDPLDFWCIRRSSGTGLIVEDCELIGSVCALNAGAGGSGLIARRLNIHGCLDGIRLATDSLVEDCYIWGLVDPNGDAHNDCIQSVATVPASDPDKHNVHIRRNNLENPLTKTSCIKIGDGSNYDFLVEDNLFNGGGYSIYHGASGANSHDLRFINNRFGKLFYPKGGYWGPVYGVYKGEWVSGNGNEWTGNVWEDGSGEIFPYP